jgi:hypothetical protein
MKIQITRTGAPLPNEAALAGARSLLFESLDGLGDDARKSWRKLWSRIIKMSHGDVI